MKFLLQLACCLFAAFTAFADIVKMTPLDTFVDGTNAVLAEANAYTDAHGGGGVNTNAVRDIAREEVAPATNAVLSSARLYADVADAVVIAAADLYTDAATNAAVAASALYTDAATNGLLRVESDPTVSLTNRTLTVRGVAIDIPTSGGGGGDAYCVKSNSVGEAEVKAVRFTGNAAQMVAGGATVLNYNSANGSGVAFGATNSAPHSFAIGEKASSSGSQSTAIGSFSTAIGESSVAIGSGSASSGRFSVAIGVDSIATEYSAFALGDFAEAKGYSSFSLGDHAKSLGDSSVAIGRDTTASGNFSSAVGRNSKALGLASTALGYYTDASNAYSTAIGYNAHSHGDYTINFGGTDDPNRIYFMNRTLADMIASGSGAVHYTDAAWSAVSNAAASVAAKQDRLPYETNAVPYSAIAAAPWYVNGDGQSRFGDAIYSRGMYSAGDINILTGSLVLEDMTRPLFSEGGLSVLGFTFYGGNRAYSEGDLKVDGPYDPDTGTESPNYYVDIPKRYNGGLYSFVLNDDLATAAQNSTAYTDAVVSSVTSAVPARLPAATIAAFNATLATNGIAALSASATLYDALDRLMLLASTAAPGPVPPPSIIEIVATGIADYYEIGSGDDVKTVLIYTSSTGALEVVSAPAGTTADLLVVGGGAGGTAGWTAPIGGGGGGGAVSALTNVTLATGSYPVTVGEGGAGGVFSSTETGTTRAGKNGAMSSFGSLLTAAGGKGHEDEASTGNYARGGTSGSGNVGGVASGGTVAGGAGGAAEVGHGGADADRPGWGGEGVTSDITGIAQVYGSGGGGGVNQYAAATAGKGGTNAGDCNRGAVVSAPDGFGGGGGGGGPVAGESSWAGGNGGSGTVIVRVNGRAHVTEIVTPVAVCLSGTVDYYEVGTGADVETVFVFGGQTGEFLVTANPSAIRADILVVGGGGGGGAECSGGGGGGHVVAGTNAALVAASYAIRVGAGGNYQGGGWSGNSAAGANGGESSIAGGEIALAAQGGGGGGGATKAATYYSGLLNGGGLGCNNQSPSAAPVRSGGAGTTTPYGSGGGGASDLGNGYAANDGQHLGWGCEGVTSDITGVAQVYGSGGGGGRGHEKNVLPSTLDPGKGGTNAGHGNYANSRENCAAPAGFGGGGGGGSVAGTSEYRNGGNGGSGTVIIRVKGKCTLPPDESAAPEGEEED